MQLRKRQHTPHRKRGTKLNRVIVQPTCCVESPGYNLTFNDLFYAFFRDYPPTKR